MILFGPTARAIKYPSPSETTVPDIKIEEGLWFDSFCKFQKQISNECFLHKSLSPVYDDSSIFSSLAFVTIPSHGICIPISNLIKSPTKISSL